MDKLLMEESLWMISNMMFCTSCIDILYERENVQFATQRQHSQAKAGEEVGKTTCPKG